jgi:hypothetical protein
METYEYTDRSGQKWVFAFSDVSNIDGKVDAVELWVYCGDRRVGGFEFEGSHTSGTRQAWRVIEQQYLGQEETWIGH